MLTTLAEAFLMSEGAGRIVFADEMAAKMFGCATEELMGLPVGALARPDTGAIPNSAIAT